MLKKSSEQIQFDKNKAKLLKKEYNKAVKENKESFLFDGKHEILIVYAKYIIEYLESKGVLDEVNLSITPSKKR